MCEMQGPLMFGVGGMMREGAWSMHVGTPAAAAAPLPCDCPLPFYSNNNSHTCLLDLSGRPPAGRRRLWYEIFYRIIVVLHVSALISYRVVLISKLVPAATGLASHRGGTAAVLVRTRNLEA